MKVRIEKDDCTGCGLCIESVPEIFEYGDDDLAKVKKSEVPEELEEVVEEAIASCPTSAISIK